jgi:hypothetical protein
MKLLILNMVGNILYELYLSPHDHKILLHSIVDICFSGLRPLSLENRGLFLIPNCNVTSLSFVISMYITVIDMYPLP